MAEGSEIEKVLPITTNEFFLSAYRSGARNVLAPSLMHPEFKTKQQAYRFAAWLVELAQMLDDEPLASSFAEIRQAIRNT